MRILIIEDDKSLSDLLAFNLKNEGYTTDTCRDGEEGLKMLREHLYDAVLLDRMLPAVDGLTLLKRIRQEGISIPVIMTTALDQLPQIVEGLDGGADDYITKPFAIDELLARLRALVRRPRQLRQADILHCADLQLDKATRQLTCESVRTSLSRRECDLLEILMKYHKKTLPRNMIFSYVWGAHAEVENGNLDNYISYVRERLREVGSQLKITTVRGVGYRLEEKDV